MCLGHIGARRDRRSLQSPRRYQKKTKPIMPSGYCAIAELPTEIILFIFDLLLFDAQCCMHNPGHHGHIPGAYVTTWSTHTDLRSRAIFPYSVANVSRSWRVISISVPKYWTRLVLLVDRRDPTPLDQVALQLELSANLPINVAVIRRADTNSHVSAGKGKAQVRSPALLEEDPRHVRRVFELLRPHLSRCMSLWYDIKYNSSLPSLHRDLRVEMPLLQILELHCEVDDGETEPFDLEVAKAQVIKEETFRCPSLKLLGINARNYFQSVAASAPWLECLPDLASMTVATFQVQTNEDKELSSYTSLVPLESLDESAELHLSGVELTYENGVCESLNIVVSTEHVTFKDLAFETLHEIFYVVDFSPQSVHIINSYPFDAANLRMPNFALTLESIDPAFDLKEILEKWEGASLTIKDCPGFDDGVLSAIGKPIGAQTTATNAPVLAISNLEELAVIDCTSFSTHALRGMVAERNSPHSRVANLSLLTLRGKVPQISKGDVDWFKTHLPAFHVYT